MTTTKPTRERIVEIDTRIAEISRDLHYLRFQIDREADSLHRAAGDTQQRVDPDDRRSALRWLLTTAEAARTCEAMPVDHYGHSVLSRWRDLLSQQKALVDESAALEDIWYEHNWSRFYYVQNANGHIHKDMHCSTCYITTEYSWLTDLSDMTEAEAVKAFGSVLCSVCYPTAPTEWTNGEPLEKIKAREEAAERKREREAKKLEKALLPDGSTLTLEALATKSRYNYETQQSEKIDYISRERITTLAQAKTWLRGVAEYRAECEAGRWEHHGSVEAVLSSMADGWSPMNERMVVEAIAAKTETTPEAVAEEFATKAAKKVAKW